MTCAVTVQLGSKENSVFQILQLCSKDQACKVLWIKVLEITFHLIYCKLEWPNPFRIQTGAYVCRCVCLNGVPSWLIFLLTVCVYVCMYVSYPFKNSANLELVLIWGWRLFGIEMDLFLFVVLGIRTHCLGHATQQCFPLRCSVTQPYTDLEGTCSFQRLLSCELTGIKICKHGIEPRALPTVSQPSVNWATSSLHCPPSGHYFKRQCARLFL